MKTLSRLLSFVAVLAALTLPRLAVQAAINAGDPAPDFTATDITGRAVNLADYRGKIVVLEWTNPLCPFVKKHYGSGNLPALQRAATADGVVWLSINSGRPGAQGDFDPEQVQTWIGRHAAAPTAYVRDRDGQIGRLFGARTTPHVFVIDPAGRVAYAGAIDSIRSADPADIAKAKNHVQVALDDLRAGRPVATPSTQPYGCGVHY